MPAEREDLHEFLSSLLEEIEKQSRVTEHFLDKERYQIYVATIWAQLVLSPDEVGLTEDDLEPLHDVLCEMVESVLGRGHDVTACFRFLNSKAGEQAMARYRLTPNHRDLLAFFCSAILDPDGHRRWMEAQREKLNESTSSRIRWR